MIVDSHCHLDFPELAAREEEVVRAASAAGVGLMVTIATRRAAWPTAIAIAQRHPQVLAAVGIHPHEAGTEGLLDPASLIEAARDAHVVAIGESGLDYYYDKSPRDAQAASFRTHVRAARETGLPLIVHTRDADEDTMALLEEEMALQPFTGVIHCYSSSADLARRAVAIGMYLGIGGILTFKRSEALRATVAELPLDRLLLETDAPYLAPVPKRGRPNEPAYTVHTANALAELLGLPPTEIAKRTTANFFELFKKAAPRAAAA